MPRRFELSEERLRAGTIDLTTVIQTEQTLFQQEVSPGCRRSSACFRRSAAAGS
jgi:hypothetical protein